MDFQLETPTLRRATGGSRRYKACPGRRAIVLSSARRLGQRQWVALAWHRKGACDSEDQAGEVERLIGLGATEVQWDKKPADAAYVILADPEGNLVLRDRYHPLT